MKQRVMDWLKEIISKYSTPAGPMKGITSASEKPHNETRVLQPAYTVRLKPEKGEKPSEQTGAPVFTIAWNGLTDVGKVRDHNEDAFTHLVLGENNFFVVADGMGGHDAGEVASRIAVETACEEIRKKAGQNSDPLGLLEEVAQQANRAVKREGDRKRSDMGTTLCAALIVGTSAYIANVGDSRAYWIENGSIRQITEDHSLVAKLVAAGRLKKEEARNHPKSNLLYRTVGNEENVKVDTFQVRLKKGGMLLLCTDGLWGEVVDEDLHRICAAEKDGKAACEELVRAANENGGRDNITAMVVNVF